MKNDYVMTIVDEMKQAVIDKGYTVVSVRVGFNGDTVNGQWFDGYISWYGGRGVMASGNELGNVLVKMRQKILALPTASDAKTLIAETIAMAKAGVPEDRANLIEIHAAF
jgi:hypothetical protein